MTTYLRKSQSCGSNGFEKHYNTLCTSTAGCCPHVIASPVRADDQALVREYVIACLDGMLC